MVIISFTNFRKKSNRVVTKSLHHIATTTSSSIKATVVLVAVLGVAGCQASISLEEVESKKKMCWDSNIAGAAPDHNFHSREEAVLILNRAIHPKEMIRRKLVVLIPPIRKEQILQQLKATEVSNSKIHMLFTT